MCQESGLELLGISDRRTGRRDRRAFADRPEPQYRITAAIGAGGMGEACRATDTKLGRDALLGRLGLLEESRP